MSTISPIKFDTLVNEVVDALPKRTKIVVTRRFGLKNGKHETLEAIGKDYGITRERVRQIEADALKQLAEGSVLEKLEPAFSYLKDHFADHGNVRAEHAILEHLAGADHPHPRRQAILFTLTLGEPFDRESETDDHHAHWSTDEASRGRMVKLLEALVGEFKDGERRLWTAEELRDAAKKHGDVSGKAADSYLDVSKAIAKNVFGEYGLSEWPEVSPRGVRDKAYLVLRRAEKPLHFSDITENINDAKFSSKKAYVQTVHNELIKDKRFVLVGRGLYALTDWGYAPGTVRDVLVDVLKEKGPLTKDALLEETMKRRIVRPNTVLLNIQNPKYFMKLEDGRYTLKNA